MVRTDEQREQHRQYVARRRQEEDYKEKENEARVILRIQDGSIPHADSLEKFNITLAQINYIRGQNNLEPIKEQIPYFMKAKVNRAFDPQNYQTFVPERVEPEERPPPPQDITASYGFSVADITLWMRENPTRVGTKSNLAKKPGTIKKQFGATVVVHVHIDTVRVQRARTLQVHFRFEFATNNKHAFPIQRTCTAVRVQLYTYTALVHSCTRTFV